MGGVIKSAGRSIGLGGAGDIENNTKMDLNFGKTIKDRNALNPDAQFRDQQMRLNKQLENQAMGVGPSLAQNQLQQATDQNIAQQMAMAASARGGNVGMAQRIAAQNAGAAQQQMAQQAGIMRLQEQQSAQGLLNQGIGQGRQGDLAGQQLKDNFGLGMRDLGNKRDMGQQAAAAQGGKMFGDFMSRAGDAAATAATGGSDKNMKKDIKSGDKEIASFLDAMKAHSYKYKDEKHGKGRHVSPMAQELEKTDIGKSMVFDSPDGKMVDYGKGLGAMLAAQAQLHERLKKLEGKKAT